MAVSLACRSHDIKSDALSTFVFVHKLGCGAFGTRQQPAADKGQTMARKVRDIQFAIEPFRQPFWQIGSVLAIGTNLHGMENVAREQLMCLRCIRHDGTGRLRDL